MLGLKRQPLRVPRASIAQAERNGNHRIEDTPLCLPARLQESVPACQVRRKITRAILRTQFRAIVRAPERVAQVSADSKIALQVQTNILNNPIRHVLPYYLQRIDKKQQRR